jgi:hypothetical protein
VNMKNSEAACDEIMRALGEVRTSWAQLAANEQRTGSPDGGAKKPAPAGEPEAPPAATSVTLSI